MTQNALLLMQAFFTQIFRIFTSIIVPGTNFTFAKLMFFFAFVPLVLKFLCSLLGIGNGSLSGFVNSGRRAVEKQSASERRNSK